MTENAILEKPYIIERNDIVDKIKSILISSLNLEYSVGQIQADEILFGAGLGLDSIDSLKLTVDIKSKFGVDISDEDMWALRSVNTLADFIMMDQGLLDTVPTNRLESYTAKDINLLTYNKIRNEAILYRNTENVILRIQDEDAFFKLNNLVSKDIDFTPEGSITQTLLLDEKGMFIAHFNFINNFNQHYIIFNKDDCMQILARFKAADICYDDLTEKCSCFSLEGYKSPGIIESCFDSVVSALKPFSFSMEIAENDSEYMVLRKDTYGECEFMIIAFDDDTKEFIIKTFESNNLLANGFDKGVDSPTKKILWLEACRFHPSLYFLKNENVIEAGLASLVSFNKETFLGKESLSKAVTTHNLICFQSDYLLSPEDIIIHDNNEIGYVVVCIYSPLLKKYIGNAYVKTACSASGAKFNIEKSKHTLHVVSAPHVIGKSYLEIT